MILKQGATLQGGKYEIQGMLGSGGFGVTYKAHHRLADKAVVIKQNAHPDGRKTFLREGGILYGLKHSHVVTVLDIFEENGTAYLVMEYLAGRNLEEELWGTGGRLPEARIRQVMEALVSALSAVHGQGICHLDIKPANIMCLPNGRIVLIDFGAARQGDTLNTHSRLAVTPGYAPPELMEGEAFGPESDIYELGVLLYRLFTGVLPPTPMKRLRGEPFDPLALPAPFGPLIAQATRLRREERPRDVVAWWRGTPARTVSQSAAHEADDFPDVPEVIAPASSPLVVPKARLTPSPESVDLGAPTISRFAARTTGGPTPGATETRKNPIDGAEMVWIPAGEFLMGSTTSGNFEDESPRRTVHLDGYWMYRYPVTVAQFLRFCKATSYPYGWIKKTPTWGWEDDHPMVGVNWTEARAYALWAGGDLPTEAQWEKAARGTDGREFPWGQAYDDTQLWGSAQTPRRGTAFAFRRANVGRSPFGCVDMAGNVWQWCRDWYDETYYASAPTDNPDGPPNGVYRILRGGSWNRKDTYVFRTTFRYRLTPEISDDSTGFRVAISESR